ncbi:MAG: N-acetylmuramoyl-L-alanine amidase, partial [Micromonosporaceae bacterium]
MRSRYLGMAVALAVALTPLSAATAAPDGGYTLSDGTERQQAFADAAADYGVPTEVLLAVSYLQSRWDANLGQPSRAAGYGPMHLTDIASVDDDPHHDHGDPRGDDSRPYQAPDDSGPAPEPPAALRTLETAAELTGL